MYIFLCILVCNIFFDLFCILPFFFTSKWNWKELFVLQWFSASNLCVRQKKNDDQTRTSNENEIITRIIIINMLTSWLFTVHCLTSHILISCAYCIKCSTFDMWKDPYNCNNFQNFNFQSQTSTHHFDQVILSLKKTCKTCKCRAF